MIVLRCPAHKISGLPSGDFWYVAKIYPDQTFTVSLNRSRALSFETTLAADLFNQRQMQLGHITHPFSDTKI